MADEPIQPEGESAVGTPDQSSQPPVIIGAQYVKDLSFENPLGPEALATLTEPPGVEIEVNTSVRGLGDNNYESVLLIRGEAKANGRTVFIVELTYGGLVTINNLPQENIAPVLGIDVPRHLFPFARAIVANVTRDGGFPPVMINPIDFAAIYAQQQSTAQEAEA